MDQRTKDKIEFCRDILRAEGLRQLITYTVTRCHKVDYSKMKSAYLDWVNTISDGVALKMWQDPKNAGKLVDLPTHVTDDVDWEGFIKWALHDGRSQCADASEFGLIEALCSGLGGKK